MYFDFNISPTWEMTKYMTRGANMSLDCQIITNHGWNDFDKSNTKIIFITCPYGNLWVMKLWVYHFFSTTCNLPRKLIMTKIIEIIIVVETFSVNGWLSLLQELKTVTRWWFGFRIHVRYLVSNFFFLSHVLFIGLQIFFITN